MLESSISWHVDVPNRCRPHDLVDGCIPPSYPGSLSMVFGQPADGRTTASREESHVQMFFLFNSDLWKIRIL